MHEAFHTGEHDFFARPNPIFMYYSARDVEDLVEVELKMEKIIYDHLKDLRILFLAAN